MIMGRILIGLRTFINADQAGKAQVLRAVWRSIDERLEEKSVSKGQQIPG
jgi:hypothetical protein